MRARTVTAALAQAHTPASREAGLDAAALWAAAAARAGADLLVLPETWLPGYPAWLDESPGAALWDHPPTRAAYARMADQAVHVPGPAADRLGHIARDHGLALVIGVVERVDAGPGRGTLYNAALTFGPDGALLNHHRKLVPTFTEKLLWGPGDADGLRAVDVPTRDGTTYRLGALICWEHWMPLSRQALHESGEDVHVALWPWVKPAHRLASRHYAHEGRCYVLASGGLLRARDFPDGLDAPQIDPDALVLHGGAFVAGPEGEAETEPTLDDERLVVATLDLDRARETRMTLDVAGHYARPDVLHFSVRRGTRRDAP